MQAVSRIAALVLMGLALAAGSASAGGPGPLFGLVNGDGQAALTHVDLLNLQPTGVRIPLGVFSRAWSFSADRTRLVVASSHNSTLGRPSALRFVDLGRMRRDGDLVLAGETDRIAGTAWTGGRVLALVVGERTAHVVAVDPDARRVVGRVALDGTVLGGAATAGGLVLLLAPRERIGPARLAVVDSKLRVRSAVLERITAGSETHGSGESLRAQAQIPALAVAAGRAYVLGAGGEPSAEVDLATLAVTYREERLLARAAKQGEGDQKARFATWLGDGLLAVGRQDIEPKQGQTATGVSVLNVRDWSLRTLDEKATSFAVGGGLVFLRDRTGVRAVGDDGRDRFRALAEWPVAEIQAYGRRVLVQISRSSVPYVALLDFGSGRVLRTWRGQAPALLLGSAAPIWG